MVRIADRRAAAVGFVLFCAACGVADAPPSASTDRVPAAEPVARSLAAGVPEERGTQAAARRRAPDPKTLAVLALGLESPDYATRLTATEALGCAPPAVALAALERQLGDPEPDVRATAIAALHTQGTDRAITLLRSVRDDEHEELALRVQAAAGLITPSISCE